METSLLRTDREITDLYEKYVDMVYRLCFTLMKNQADTEDAVQNTFIKLIRYPKSFQSETHEKAWLLVTAANTCKDALRRMGRNQESLDTYENDLCVSSCDMKTEDILKSVLSLPVPYKTVIYLYYYEGYTSKEIASLFNKPASTIRNYMHKAREQLKIMLGEDFDEE